MQAKLRGKYKITAIRKRGLSPAIRDAKVGDILTFTITVGDCYVEVKNGRTHVSILHHMWVIELALGDIDLEPL